MVGSDVSGVGVLVMGWNMRCWLGYGWLACVYRVCGYGWWVGRRGVGSYVSCYGVRVVGWVMCSMYVRVVCWENGELGNGWWVVICVMVSGTGYELGYM